MRRSAFALVLALALAAPSARAAEPVKLGFSMSLTGALANTGRVALAAIKLWEADINSKGGILGRPVQLVYYDDQSTSANVPTIYTKLLDVDKVDLVVGPYSTAQTAPAMADGDGAWQGVHRPKRDRHQRPFPLSAVFLDDQRGAGPERDLLRGLSSPRRCGRTPKPQTIAFSGGDIEFSQSVSDGRARDRQSGGSSKPSTTNPTRRRPPTTHQSCARCRPPIPTCSSCVLSAGFGRLCAPSTRSAFARKCWAAPLLG